jgi:integrase
MPRKVRDSSLETRTARSRLAVAHKPYFRLIEPGLHLGYRKLPSGPGTWVARRYSGEGRYSVQNLRTAEGEIVLADDFADADGVRVLDFAQAQRAARGPRAARGGLTVADVMARYLDYLRSDGRSEHSIHDTSRRAEVLILPTLGAVKVSALTPDRLRRWRDDVASAAPRLRTAPGAKQNYRPMPEDEDGQRSRRSTANRTWTVLRAALNHAFHEGIIEQDTAWRKVKPFKNVEAARVRYLTVAEAKRLTNASDPDFRSLVQAALQTGCRFGELIRLTVADYNRDAGTVGIRKSKSGKARHVVLTLEGIELFGALSIGRPGHEPLLCKDNGESWGRGQQWQRMTDACQRAKISPPISFHGLRHTWASLSVMGGVPLMVVARNLGHSDTRMVEKHYGHLAESYVADEIRKKAPRFAFKPTKGEVVAIRGQ